MNKEALLWEPLEKDRVHCFLCSHGCNIAESKFGICGVRQNIKGVLYTLVYGRPIATNVDPVEKKPLYHFLPSTMSYSIATIGCNFKCGFCQNWQISQASMKEGNIVASDRELMPGQIVDHAKECRCKSISYTYTEPTIFFEYALDTAIVARKEGLANIFVTNGYMSRQALDMAGPYLDAANVDLKSFRDNAYRRNCRARLQPVLNTIAAMKEMGIWVEVTTLIVPGENDSDMELNQIAGFLAGIDINIPWHISRFHPEYQFQDYQPTPIRTLSRAREIGLAKGLHYVYLGNVQKGSNTYCQHCGELVVERKYMGVDKLYLKDGQCLHCGLTVSGVWS